MLHFLICKLGALKEPTSTGGQLSALNDSEHSDCNSHKQGLPLSEALSHLGVQFWLLASGSFSRSSGGQGCSVQPPTPHSQLCIALWALTEPRTVHLSQSMCHASLVTQESREVHRLARVIPRPCLHLAPVPVAPLMGQEAQMSMPRGRELPVGLGAGEEVWSELELP